MAAGWTLPATNRPGRVHSVLHLDPRIKRLKVIDELSGHVDVGGRVDEQLSFLLGRRNGRSVLSRITAGYLALRRESTYFLSCCAESDRRKCGVHREEQKKAQWPFMPCSTDTTTMPAFDRFE